MQRIWAEEEAERKAEWEARVAQLLVDWEKTSTLPQDDEVRGVSMVYLFEMAILVKFF